MRPKASYLASVLLWLVLSLSAAALLVFVAWIVIHTVPYGTAQAQAEVIRVIGIGAQLLGLLSVAAGIEQTRRFFGRKLLWERIVEYIKGLFPSDSDPVVANLGHAISPSRAYGIATNKARPDDTDERIALLEQQFDKLHVRLEELDQQTQNELRKVEKEIEEEKRQRVEQREEIDQRVEDLSVGGLTVEGFGFVCLTSGLLLTSLPNRIAALLLVFDLIP